MNRKLINLAILSFTVLMLIGTVTATPDKLSANVGTKVDVSIAGLTDTTDYKILDAYGELVEAFTASGTTHKTKVNIVLEGENTFDLCNFSTGAVLVTFTVHGTDPVEDVYIIFPLIIVFGLVTVVMKFFDKI